MLFYFLIELSSWAFFFCSTAERSEWLVVSCVLLCIRCSTVVSLLLFLLWWVFMFYYLKLIVKPRSCTNKTLTSKDLFISHLSMLEAVPWHFWGPVLRWPKLCKAFHFIHCSPLSPLLWATRSASPFSPGLTSGEREDCEATTTNFKTRGKKWKFRTIYQIKESKFFLKRLAFLSA